MKTEDLFTWPPPEADSREISMRLQNLVGVLHAHVAKMYPEDEKILEMIRWISYVNGALVGTVMVSGVEVRPATDEEQRAALTQYAREHYPRKDIE